MIPSRSNDAPGRCLVLVGTLTATTVECATTNPFGAPDVSMIIGGRNIGSQVNECDGGAIEAAGYAWILDAEVTEGTRYEFYDEFFIPDGSGTIEALVVGSPSGTDAVFFDPTPTPAIPPL